MNRFFKIAATSVAVAALLCVGMILDVQLRHINRIHERIEDAPTKPIAIVLGASVMRDGTPSDALKDRILTAAALYRTGKVEALLMTGDDGAFHVNEISVMAATAREAGVPERAILTDGEGYRTYESCKRAVQTLNIRSALIITQRFHLGRALYLCRSFGMDAEGVVADRQSYVRIAYFWLRDLASSAKAFWDIHVISPKSPVPGMTD